MGALDTVLDEVESHFGVSTNNATTLLSGLVGYISKSGGPNGFFDRFHRVGLGETASSWLSGEAKPVSAENVQAALGSGTVSTLASRAGMSISTAAAALGFLIPKVMQRMAPGGSLPGQVPPEFSGYMSDTRGAAPSGTLQTIGYETERAAMARGSRLLWPLLFLIILLVIGFWLWRGRQAAIHRRQITTAERVRSANQRVRAAFAALRPGFSSRDLVDVLNRETINFPSGSAEIPPESAAVLDQAAVAMKAAPPNSKIEIRGHVDVQGGAGTSMELSQERADAVRAYLVQRGVDESMLVAKDYGDTKPLPNNNTDGGGFRNKSIEFVAIQ